MSDGHKKFLASGNGRSIAARFSMFLIALHGFVLNLGLCDIGSVAFNVPHRLAGYHRKTPRCRFSMFRRGSTCKKIRELGPIIGTQNSFYNMVFWGLIP